MGPAARRPSRPCVCVSRCVSRVFTFVPVNIGAKDHSLRRVAALTRCCSRPGPICRRSCRLCCDGHLRASTFTVCCGALPLERNAEPFCLALDPAEGYICPPRSFVRCFIFQPRCWTNWSVSCRRKASGGEGWAGLTRKMGELSLPFVRRASIFRVLSVSSVIQCLRLTLLCKGTAALTGTG